MPTAPHPAVICSLERLEPLDALNDGYRYFGLNVAVSLVPGNDGSALPAAAWIHLIRTWSWQNIQIHLSWLDWPLTNATPLGTVTATPIVPDNSSGSPFANFDFTELVARFEQRETAMRRDAALTIGDEFFPFIWNVDQWDPETEAAVGSPDRSWKHLQTRLSQEPFPLPQLVQFTYGFCVPVNSLAVAENKFLVASPLLTAPDGSSHTWTFARQASNKLFQVGSLDLLRWEYSVTGSSGATSPPSTAYSYHRPIPFSRSYDQDDFFNFGDFWIYPEGSPLRGASPRTLSMSGWEASNWTAMLKEKAADFCNLPRFLLNVGRTVIGLNPSSGLPLALVAPTVAALHDTANAGLFQGPDESSLIADVMDALWRQHFRQDMANALNDTTLGAPNDQDPTWSLRSVLWQGMERGALDAMRRLDTTLSQDGWEAFLRKKLAEVVDSPLLERNRTNCPPLPNSQGILRELERLTNVLERNQSLIELFLGFLQRGLETPEKLAFHSPGSLAIDFFLKTYNPRVQGGTLALSARPSLQWSLTMPEWKYIPEVRFPASGQSNVVTYQLFRRDPGSRGAYEQFAGSNPADPPRYSVEIVGREVVCRLVRFIRSYQLQPLHEFELHALDADGNLVEIVSAPSPQILNLWPVFEWQVVHNEVVGQVQAARLSMQPVSATHLQLRLFDPSGNELTLNSSHIAWPEEGGLSLRILLGRSAPDAQPQRWSIELQQFDNAVRPPVWRSLTTAGQNQFDTPYTFDRAWIRARISGAPANAGDPPSGQGVTVHLRAPSALNIPRSSTSAEQQLLTAAWDVCPHGTERVDADRNGSLWRHYSDILRQDVLANRDLGRSLKQANIGIFWAELLKRTEMGMTQAQELSCRWEATLRNYFNKRLSPTLTLPAGACGDFSQIAYSSYVPVTSLHLLATERDAFDAYVSDYALLTAQQMLPPDSARREVRIAARVLDVGDAEPTPVPHPVAIQVHEAGSLPAPDDDGLRGIAGIGILARQRTADGASWERWRLLNSARLELRNSTNDQDYYCDIEGRRVVVPLPILYRDGVRQAIFEYDNHPLAARSPAQAFNESLDAEASPQIGPTNQALGIERLLDLQVENNGPLVLPQWGDMPGLKFGQTYEFAAFMIGNSGALPVSLVAASTGGQAPHPARLCAFSSFDHDAGVPEDARRTVVYLRRVPASCLRVGDSAGLQLPFAWPRLIDGVAPFARETVRRLEDSGSLTSRSFYKQGPINGHYTGQLDLSGGAWQIGLRDVVLPNATGNSLTLRLQQLDADVTGDEISVMVGRSGAASLLWLLETPDGTQTSGSVAGAFADALDLDIRSFVDNGAITIQLAARNSRDPNWVASDIASGLSPPDLSNNWLEFSMVGGRSCHAMEVRVGSTAVEASLDDTTPLLLLADDSDFAPKELQWAIYPPSTDFETWDRWLARDQHVASTASDRNAIRQQRISFREQFAERKNNDRQAAVVDPAVLGVSPNGERTFAHFELHPVRASSSATVSQLDVDFPSAGFASPFEPQGIAVKCQQDTTAGLTQNGNVIEVKVPPAQVWELRIRVAVAAKWFDDPAQVRIHPRLREGSIKYLRNNGDAYYLLAPWNLLIECASPDMPSEDMAWHAMKLALRNTTVGQKVAVSYGAPSAAADPMLAFVKRVTLRRQLFRWQGRIVPDFPAHQLSGPGGGWSYPSDLDALPTSETDWQNVLLWEASGFSARRDDDSAFSEACTLPVKTSDCLNPVLNDSVIYEEDITEDKRALLYRFHIELESRYAALWPRRRETRVVAMRDEFKQDLLSQATPSPLPAVDWKRIIAPCRYDGEIPAPTVKLIIPLPGGSRPPGWPSSEPSLPALLAIITDPWGRDAGIAERIQAEICRVQAGSTIYELAPDPTLSPQQLSDFIDPSFIELRVEGPVGHTFDQAAMAPKFVGTSYVIRLDVKRVDSRGQDLQPVEISARLAALKDFVALWPLVHIQLRRSYLVDDSASGALQWRSGPLSPPKWAQFVPDSSRLEATFGSDATPVFVEPTEVRLERALAPNGTMNELRLVRKGDDSSCHLAPPVATDGKSQFLQLALLTELISDVGRRQDAEKYIGVYRPYIVSNQTQLAAVDAASTPNLDDSALRLRVLTFQQRRDRLKTAASGGSANSRATITYFDRHEGWPAGFRLEQLSPEGIGTLKAWQIGLAGIEFDIQGGFAPRGDVTFYVDVQAVSVTNEVRSVMKLELNYEQSADLLEADCTFDFPNGTTPTLSPQPVDDALATGPFDLRIAFSKTDRWRVRVDHRKNGDAWHTQLLNSGEIDLGRAVLDGLALRIELSLQEGTRRAGWSALVAPPTITAGEPVIWEQLFRKAEGQAEPLDSALRLVGVSPPIDSFSVDTQAILSACRSNLTSTIEDWRLVINAAQQLSVPIVPDGSPMPTSSKKLFTALSDPKSAWITLGSRSAAELRSLAESGWFILAIWHRDQLSDADHAAIVTPGPLDAQENFPSGCWGKVGPQSSGSGMLNTFFADVSWVDLTAFGYKTRTL